VTLGWLWWRAWFPVTPLHFVWEGWHLATSTCILRCRRGTSGFVRHVLRVATQRTHTLLQATLSHASLSYVPFTISCLFPAFPIPSSPFFCDFCKKLTCGVIRSFNYYFHSTSSTYLPTSLPTYLSTYPPTYLPTYLPMYLPIYLYLSTHLPPEHHIFITINILILKAEKSI
jgi:hypothetical protein